MERLKRELLHPDKLLEVKIGVGCVQLETQLISEEKISGEEMESNR